MKPSIVQRKPDGERTDPPPGTPIGAYVGAMAAALATWTGLLTMLF